MAEPVTDDANATATQLQQRAAQDLANAQAAAAQKQAQGAEQRQGILPGGGR
jgi:type IV secretory pathway TrbL component